jgi:hypothetical protein
MAGGVVVRYICGPVDTISKRFSGTAEYGKRPEPFVCAKDLVYVVHTAYVVGAAIGLALFV